MRRWASTSRSSRAASPGRAPLSRAGWRSSTATPSGAPPCAPRDDGRWPGPTRPLVTYSLAPDDVRKARRAVRVLGDALLAAGATEVYPGVPGFDAVVTDRARMARFEAEGSLVARDYTMSMTHLFGTARMGGSPATSVVRLDFRHHATDALYVADSSVFPSNLGVNPQIAIRALAELCAEHVARS